MKKTPAVKFGVDDWATTPPVSAADLVARLQLSFPDMQVDWSKGDAMIQSRYEELAAMGAPAIILNAHKNYFGNVVHIVISPSKWSGATVHGYLYNTSFALGDVVSLTIEDAPSTAAKKSIISELELALAMRRIRRQD